MTISEANAVFTLLRFCTGGGPPDFLGGRPKTTCAEQIEAAQLLNQRASKALQMQVMTDLYIAEHWPRSNDPADPTSWDADMVAKYNSVYVGNPVPGMSANELEAIRREIAKVAKPQVTSARYSRRKAKAGATKC